MADIKNIDKLMAKFRGLVAKIKTDDDASVVVGYTAQYAIYVHENLEMKLKGKPRPSGLGVYWGPHGQPKFLEGPARQFARELGEMVGQAIKRGATAAQALLQAGLRLQRESQLRVPVEYGNLRNSAFTRVE